MQGGARQILSLSFPLPPFPGPFPGPLLVTAKQLALLGNSEALAILLPLLFSSLLSRYRGIDIILSRFGEVPEGPRFPAFLLTFSEGI